jgi:hypothetical protein
MHAKAFGLAKPGKFMRFISILIIAYLIFGLPASSLSAGSHATQHAHDEFVDKSLRYTAPALHQSLTKAISLLLSPTEVVVFWIIDEHVLLEMPPEVLSWFETWRVWWPSD